MAGFKIFRYNVCCAALLCISAYPGISESRENEIIASEKEPMHDNKT